MNTSTITSETLLTTPLRSQIPDSEKWDLTSLYPSEESWESDLQTLLTLYPQITKFQNHLSQSQESLLEALRLESQIDQLSEKLAQFASLKLSEDSSNTASLERQARLENTLLRVAEALSFIGPELLSLDDQTYQRIIQNPSLQAWKNSLIRLRRLKPHTLSEKEERLLAISSATIRGHGETFSQLTNVDMKFGLITDEDGQPREVTQSSLSSFLTRQTREVRKNAFHTFYSEIESHAFTLASTLANSIKADVFLARARNYPSALEAALFPDDVPNSVYDNLISTVRSKLPSLHRYYELRRQILRLDEIHHYDTYVPLLPDLKINTPWLEAVEKVIAALEPLGPEYTSILKQGLTSQRWCDIYENKGKRSGAFSYGTYSGHPYILINYKDDVFADVFTLAHEAGHSMHTLYARQSQPFQDYRYPIFLAEVASTLNEFLLTEYLLSQAHNTQIRAFIINRQLDDLRGTLFRQTMFAEFEKITHAAEENGDGLTLDTFRSIYRRLLNDYFGPNFTLDPQLELEALRIPHFYSAFYVYKYATGLSAAAALARNILNTGNPEPYLNLLSSGGSQFPIQALLEAGVDMRSPHPILAALDLFDQRLSELQSLLLPHPIHPPTP